MADNVENLKRRVAELEAKLGIGQKQPPAEPSLPAAPAPVDPLVADIQRCTGMVARRRRELENVRQLMRREGVYVRKNVVAAEQRIAKAEAALVEAHKRRDAHLAQQAAERPTAGGRRRRPAAA